MANTQSRKATCRVCGEEKPLARLMPAAAVRPAIAELIRKEHPDWSTEGYICSDDLDRYRALYVQSSLEAEKGQFGELEKEVVRALKEQETLSRNLNDQFDSRLTFGQRMADKVAEFGGSWKFIIMFGCVLCLWIIVNSIALLHRPFDPFPFILLNLVLSCIASIQAPVIMMSQNRQEAKDRLRAEHDYQVNLKAEIEIRNLGEKFDHLLHEQWQRLLEIQ